MVYGASRYQEQSGNYLSSREAEAMAFRRVNAMLEAARSPESRREALSVNYRLWGLLMQGADRSESPLPPVLRQDILSLGTWVLAATNRAMNTIAPLRPLIDVNGDMIEGLSALPAGLASPAGPSPDAYRAVRIAG